MQNELIKRLDEYRGNNSRRRLAKEIGLSHSFVTDIMAGRRPVTWGFAYLVSKPLGLEPDEAFKLAGLLPTSVAEKGSVGATGVKE